MWVGPDFGLTYTIENTRDELDFLEEKIQHLEDKI